MSHSIQVLSDFFVLSVLLVFVLFFFKIHSDFVTTIKTRGELKKWSNRNKYDSIATVGVSQVWWSANFQSGSRVLKKVF